MFELHGWATVRFTPENRERDDEECLQQAVVTKVESQIHTYVSALGWDHNPRAGIRWVNGEALVQVEGFTNHAGTIAREVETLFRFIAEVAPGSYGLIYTLNDEDPEHSGDFRVYVLRRGEYIEHADPFLSPHFPLVEDPYDGD